MKILYVSPYPPARDGIGDYTWLLANRVRDVGVDIAVVVPYGIPAAPPEVLGVLAAAGRARAELTQVIAQWQPEIVHVQFAIAAFGSRTAGLLIWLRALCRDLNIPVVVTLHEVARESALLGAAGRGVHRWIARHTDQFIVHTDLARDALAAELGELDAVTAVVPHPSVQPRAATALSADLRLRFGLAEDRVMLAFGFIHVDKGLDDLISAVAILQSQAPDVLAGVRVVVAGAVRPRHGLFRLLEFRDRVYLARLARQIKAHGLGRQVVLTGYVPDGEVAPWFELADAVVLPYRRAEQSGVEGLARAFDVPVLASAVGGLVEQLAGSKWTFPPRSPAQIAETVTDFLASSAVGHARAPSADLDADLACVTRKTIKIYESVLARRGGRVSHVA